MDARRILKDRVLSSFGISVGTGIALESLFTPTEMRIDDLRKVSSFNKDYKILYISIYTLLRNIIQCMPSKESRIVMDSGDITPLLNIVKEEMSIIKTIGSTVNKEVIFFRYTPIKSQVVKVDNKKPTRVDFMREKYLKIVDELEIDELKNKISDSVMLTNLGFDLVDYKGFWLKSHTGEVTPVIDFNKVYKVLKDQDMDRFPFCGYLLSIFGDKSGLIPTGKPKEIRSIYAYLVGKKITPYRTESWVKTQMKQY